MALYCFQRTFLSSIALKNGLKNLSSSSAAITKIHRNNYLLKYPTTLVLPDGSSITIRYHEPREIIKLPLDLSTLTPDEVKVRLDRRKPRTKIKMKEEKIQAFDSRKYVNIIKNK